MKWVCLDEAYLWMANADADEPWHAPLREAFPHQYKLVPDELMARLDAAWAALHAVEDEIDKLGGES